MHKISNFTGQARHGWDKMAPSMGFGMSRSHNEMAMPPAMKGNMPTPTTATRPGSPSIPPNQQIHLSFNVPFSSQLAGPEPSEVIYANPGAFDRWTHPEGTPETTPNHKLPVHAQNLDNLRAFCRSISERSDGRLNATVVSSEPKPLPGLQRGPFKALVTNVCLSGDYSIVKGMRGKILTEMPISLRSASVDIDQALVFQPDSQEVKKEVLEHLDQISAMTKTDIFLLTPKPMDESASFNGPVESLDQRFRVIIYGDMESSEHAKTRVLIMIDQILGRFVDTMKLELTLHTLICGRARKNIKLIESATNTAIYFPPPFPRIYRYMPQNAVRRPDDEIIITGESKDAILTAKKRLHDLVVVTKAYVKEIKLTASKMDSLLLERLDKIQKIIENNGTYVLLPHLGLQHEKVRVQGTDILHVERTVREIQTLAGQFYSASWWITPQDVMMQRIPTRSDIFSMLSDISINSGAEVSFENYNFHIHGSDDSVKAAMMVIYNIPFVKKSAYTMKVRVELANEHKEFVSGKKNGKINKIMSHSQVQILFDAFNDYNFYINIQGNSYDSTKLGLDLVEQEMPASISFHVPDQYHKRIIGIGGSHIQRIMKKYSVFVKFSNAMDRGGAGKEDDDIKVDNVICRTPSRNAQNLDLVKQEIMEMVEKADAEFVTEKVPINRLYHRQLISRMTEIEELEKKWNCKITFPSTEQASDLVTVSGPEWQVPQAVDEFLGMVPESHELSFTSSKELSEYLRKEDFEKDIVQKMKDHYLVEVRIQQSTETKIEGKDVTVETLRLGYTRNNAGGVKDAIDFMLARLVAQGLDETTVKGAIPRPKSDSFEDSIPFFQSKVLQPTGPDATDSPTRSHFGDNDSSERTSLIDRLRKPGSMSSFTSLLDRRKNGSNSPGSLFKHASSNASKASLVSLESAGSYRNPWNDSGINLTEEDHNGLHPHSAVAAGWNGPAVSRAWDASSASSATTASKFPFGLPMSAAMNASSTSLGALSMSAVPTPVTTTAGDVTPRLAGQDHRGSVDSGRPSTSHSQHNGLGHGHHAHVSNSSSSNGYPGPIGPPR